MKKEDLIQQISKYSHQNCPDFYKKYTNDTGWIIENLFLLSNVLLHDLLKELRNNYASIY
jgi:hypothetical protein